MRPEREGGRMEIGSSQGDFVRKTTVTLFYRGTNVTFTFDLHIRDIDAGDVT